jgi:plastocyanin domain-containing protein
VGQEKTGLLIVLQNGTHKPSRIKIIANQATELYFLLKDASPCAEELIFPDLDISASLPVDKTMTILVPAQARREYAFHCHMQMYRGRLLVGCVWFWSLLQTYEVFCTLR